MKVRATIAGTALSVRLTAIGWATLTVLASALISGCSGSSTSTPPVVFSPTVSGSASVSAGASVGGGVGASSSARADTPSATATPSDSPSVSPTALPTQTLTPTPNPTPTPTPTVTQSASPFPSAAPVTGGGGTAGFQDGLLLVLGLAAIVAGAGSIAYRRRLTRNR